MKYFSMRFITRLIAVVSNSSRKKGDGRVVGYVELLLLLFVVVLLEYTTSDIILIVVRTSKKEE